MQKKSTNMTSLVLGLSLGVLGGLLVAPLRDRNIRTRLAYQLKKFGGKMHIFAKELARFNGRKIVSTTAKVAGQEVIDKTVEKAQKILEEVKALAAQLESNH